MSSGPRERHKSPPRFDIDLVAVEKRGRALTDLGNPLDLTSVTAFADQSVRTARRQRHSEELRRRLAGGAYRHADVVHVEGGYLAHLLPDELLRRACLIEHNVESALLRQAARIGRDGRLMQVAGRVARLEERAWASVAAVVATTAEDQAEISARSGREDVRVVTNGADHIPAAGLRSMTTRPVLVMVGNFAYRPTADALGWLVGMIWPRVLAELPQARLDLVGGGMTDDQRLDSLSRPGVAVIGQVDDIGPSLDGARAFIAPLRIGGGVKMKVLEALRRECPVVTTTIGAQGIHGANRALLSIADDPARLAAHVVSLLSAAPGTKPCTPNRTATLPSWSSAAHDLEKVWNEVGHERVG